MGNPPWTISSVRSDSPSPSNNPLPVSPEYKGGAWGHLCLSLLGFWRPDAVDHSSCEIVIARAMSCFTAPTPPTTTIPPPPPHPILWLFHSSCLLSHYVPDPWCGELNTDVSCRTGHWISYSQRLVHVSTECCPLQEAASLPKAKSSTGLSVLGAGLTWLVGFWCKQEFKTGFKRREERHSWVLEHGLWY